MRKIKIFVDFHKRKMLYLTAPVSFAGFLPVNNFTKHLHHSFFSTFQISRIFL